MDNVLGLFAKRNAFDLTHERKFSCDMGKLIPIMCEEIYPGDTFHVKTDMLVRLAPLVAPVMHRLNVFTHFFFVPTRLVWDGFQDFITGGADGKDATVLPTRGMQIAAGDIGDYFGLPLNTSGITVNVLPFRAYNLIYNEWYRDQNVQAKKVTPTTSGTDTSTDIGLWSRNWEKDYFTSALPWAQRGDEVTIGMTGTADVVIPADTAGNIDGQTRIMSFDGTSTGTIKVDAADTYRVVSENAAGTDRRIFLKGQRDLDGTGSGDLYGEADLSTASAVSINALRAAFQVQKWLERNARAGSRYVESILAHFGVRSSDARLQRPEFLGGGRSPIIISEVLQTSKTETNAPQGNMSGHGYSALQSHGFKKSFEEHGYLIGIMSIMPRTAYQQGVSRMWTRSTRYDYYFPEFAHLGEQPVKKKELYFMGNANDELVFGYQGRYDELRRRESLVAGEFRTDLDHWHMGRILGSEPSLNSSFVTCDPTDRVFAVLTGHKCWVQLLNQVKAIRPLPKIGEPGLIDHN